MSAKRGDWRTVSSVWHGSREAAREEAQEYMRRHPEDRFRTNGLSSLGYVVQVFVERKVRKA